MCQPASVKMAVRVKYVYVVQQMNLITKVGDLWANTLLYVYYYTYSSRWDKNNVCYKISQNMGTLSPQAISR